MSHSHLANARHAFKRIDEPLHVIAVVFNPLRFQSRRNLYREFEHHAKSNPHAILYTVELAFGERPFEVTEPDNPRHWQIRTETELWHKERMINAAVSRFCPADWKYVAWVDADITFVNPDWAHETLQQLQHYDIVQMFTHAMDVGPNGEPTDMFESFAHSRVLRRPFAKLNNGASDSNNVPYYSGRYWHPGYGWAYRRNAWNTLGGLLDINIIGGGDHQMAYGLIGRVEETIPFGSTCSYTKVIRQWAERAGQLKQNIGAVPGTIMHHFHGKKVNRGYYNRWRVLTDNKFDPVVDLKNDWQGMLSLAGNKPDLRDDLRAYFRARNEDSTV